MTPTRLRECLASLRWSQRGLATILACDDKIIRQMAAGVQSIPDSLAIWLETLAAAHDANPPPIGWKRPYTRIK